MNLVRVRPWQLSQYLLLSVCSHCLSVVCPLAAVVNFVKGAYTIYLSCTVAMDKTCEPTSQKKSITLTIT